MIINKIKETSTRKFEDVKNIYLNNEFNDNVDMYKVDVYEYTDELIFARTTMYPIIINKEYNMTKGHYHVNEYSEIYICESGEGYLMTVDKVTNLEKMTAGSAHYIRPNSGHRVINTGNTNLVFVSIYNKDSKQDYKTFKPHIRVFEDRIDNYEESNN